MPGNPVAAANGRQTAFTMKLRDGLGKAKLIALAATVAALIALAPPFQGAASAHANLVRSQPAANSVLDASPKRVAIWFSETLEARFSEIQVLDGTGARVDAGDSTVDANDATLMSVGLPPLPNGAYTVAWRNLSTVDGHRLRGVFVFSVGEPISAAALPDAEPPLLQSPEDPAIRWLALLGALALTGKLAFELLVSNGVYAAAGTRSPLGRLRARIDARSRSLLWLVAASLAAASIAQVLTQAAALFETTLAGALGAPVMELLLLTDWGTLWLWRMGLLAFALAALALPAVVRFRRMRHQRRFETALSWIALTASLGILLTLSLTSHAAATPQIARFALLNDMLHLAAVAVWVGGLFQLIVGTPLFIRGMPESARRLALSHLVKRFSVLAALSVGTLIVTGAYSAWAQVTLPAALVTPYGAALLAKLALILPLLLLGAVNLIWVRPRLRGSGKAARWLRRIVVGEAALATLVILAVGFLTSLEPARQAAARMGIGQPNAAVFSDTLEGAEVTLTIEPARVGVNTIAVRLADGLGEPIADAADVRVRLSYLEADFGEEAVSAANAGGGEYMLADALISIAGAWQAELLVQRNDAFDGRAAFRFEALPAGVSGALIAPNAADAALYMGIALALVGFLFLATGIPMGGWYNRGGAAVMACGGVIFIAGAVLAVGSTGGDAAQTAGRNPILPTSDSVAAGKVVYERYCLSCHGEAGRGDGLGGAGLEPPPADLVLHVPLHPDADLYGFISDGIEGTAMAALGERLTDQEIWHAVNYIRTLADE